eukprot:TRINITY_DN12222_c0_g1_i2.p1 TRINITY_DN12222_c0_g1~~TRINITY_DN12222_c0_g1_i2.p1  ORF type:complete len:463 (+),score=86.65 TRINITY_DN12222_c0_g1_i2:226-1614(+)
MVPNPFRKPGSKERATIEKIVDRKIMVKDSRLKELEALREDLQSSPPEEAAIMHVLVVHITAPVIKEKSGKTSTPEVENEAGCSNREKQSESDREEDYDFGHDSQGLPALANDSILLLELRLKLNLIVKEVALPENGWKVFKQRLGRKAEEKPDVIVMTIFGDVLSDMAKTVIATSVMQGMPVVTFALPDCAESVAGEAFRYSGGTWPVFWDEGKLSKYVSEEIPSLIRVRDAIIGDVNEHVKQYKKLNPLKHGAKRAAVALIPFAIHAVNVAGMIRLCGRMMIKTGMVGDRESQKVVAGLGALTTGAVTVIDEIGDIYQYVIYATVLYDFATASSLEVAAQSLTVFDGFLLGSVTVVTGIVSAIGAYVTRPGLVDTLAAFIANLQVLYLLNPEMRRMPEPAAIPDEEKLRLLDEDEKNSPFDGEDEVMVPPAQHETATSDHKEEKEKRRHHRFGSHWLHRS